MLISKSFELVCVCVIHWNVWEEPWIKVIGRQKVKRRHDNHIVIQDESIRRELNVDEW